MVSRLFLCACSMFFFGWASSIHAFPVVDPGDLSDLDSTALAAKNTRASKSKKSTKSTKPTKTSASATKPSKKASLSGSKKQGFLPQPSADFVCPHATQDGATACFLEAVEHLYTVCRRVKSIELLEFGFEKAEEGSNGLKSEFCRQKQKVSMPPYFDAALQEVQAVSCEAALALNDMYAVWNTMMTGLRQRPDETEDEYQQRNAVSYPAFSAYRQQVVDALDKARQQPAQNCPTLVTFTP